MKEAGVRALQSVMARLNITEEGEDVRDLARARECGRTAFLPPALAGWLLLQRSSLNPQERAAGLSSATARPEPSRATRRPPMGAR